jgi:hypothetical protein
MTMGAKADRIKSLKLIEQLRRNIHMTAHANGLLGWHYRHPPHFFLHIVQDDDHFRIRLGTDLLFFLIKRMDCLPLTRDLGIQ